MHEAKTNLTKLVKEAAGGEPFTIAISGKPMVDVTPCKDKVKVDREKWLGFMKGKMKVPDDFDNFCSKEIEELFS
jgi:antitoxin (DNA-binding transcriptional repressor) of toxin-antitoxin stability system